MYNYVTRLPTMQPTICKELSLMMKIYKNLLYTPTLGDRLATAWRLDRHAACIAMSSAGGKLTSTWNEMHGVVGSD